MSATTLAEQGMAHVQSKDWAAAIPPLTKAIDQSKSPQWLLARSTAYMETGDLHRSLRDAEYAYCTAVERGNDKSRKQMIEAQHRRSVIYFRQKLFGNADVCACWAQELAKGTAIKAADHVAKHIDEQGFYHATAADLVEKDATGAAAGKLADNTHAADHQREKAWRTVLLSHLEALPADDPARKITVKLVPTKPTLEDAPAKPQEHDPELEAAKIAARVVSAPASSNGPFRSDFYQSDGTCTVSLFMKFASKDDTSKVQVDFQPNLITITGVPREPSTAYLVPHATIDPTKSSFRALTMKIELTLAKVQPRKWANLGHEELSKPDESILAKVASTPSVPHTEKAPSYPTSALRRADVEGAVKQDAEEEEEKEKQGGGDVQGLFEKIFQSGDEDLKRAMNKSFQESNGTALSTDWAQVSKGPVETNPPDGMEAVQYPR